MEKINNVSSAPHIAVFMWMNSHREHSGHNDFSVFCGDLSGK